MQSGQYYHFHFTMHIISMTLKKLLWLNQTLLHNMSGKPKHKKYYVSQTTLPG